MNVMTVVKNLWIGKKPESIIFLTTCGLFTWGHKTWFVPFSPPSSPDFVKIGEGNKIREGNKIGGEKSK